MGVRGARPEIALIDVVGENGVERRHVAGHAGHERCQQRREPEPQEPVGEIVQQHRWGGEIVVEYRMALGIEQRTERGVQLGGNEGRPAAPLPASAIIPGRITSAGKSILGIAAMSGVRRAAVIDSADMARCTIEKIGAPVAEGEYEPESHEQTEPLHTNRVL